MEGLQYLLTGEHITLEFTPTSESKDGDVFVGLSISWSMYHNQAEMSAYINTLFPEPRKD